MFSFLNFSTKAKIVPTVFNEVEADESDDDYVDLDDQKDEDYVLVSSYRCDDLGNDDIVLITKTHEIALLERCNANAF
jgi:hypothetical protein